MAVKGKKEGDVSRVDAIGISTSKGTVVARRARPMKPDAFVLPASPDAIELVQAAVSEAAHKPEVEHLEASLAAMQDAVSSLTAGLIAARNAAAHAGTVDVVSVEALEAFADAVAGVLAQGGGVLTVESARRAGLLAVAATAWESALGALFDTTNVRDLLGGISRQRVDELLKEHRLIAMKTNAGRWAFPSFQFRDGQAPPASLATAFWQLSDTALDPWSAASWCVSANSHLDGRSPAAAAAENPEQVAVAGARDAERLGR